MHGLSSSLRLKDRRCVDSLYMYTLMHPCVCVCVHWGNRLYWFKVRIIFCGLGGQRELALRQDRANSESIKLTGVMNTEGRLHPRCAERALTARTLSGFFIGTQATAQSSALNTTNGKRGNGIFICLSSSGGRLLIMHWNTGPCRVCVLLQTSTTANVRCVPPDKAGRFFFPFFSAKSSTSGIFQRWWIPSY